MDEYAAYDGYWIGAGNDARLRLDAETVLAWARQGRIRLAGISQKVIRFKLADVEAALKAHQSLGSAEVGS